MDKFAIRSRLTAAMRQAIEDEVTKFRADVPPGMSKAALVRAFRANMQRAFLEKVDPTAPALEVCPPSGG